MDANAEGGPPQVELAEVDVEVSGVPPRAAAPAPTPEPAAPATPEGNTRPDAAPATTEPPTAEPEIAAPSAASLFSSARGWAPPRMPPPAPGDGTPAPEAEGEPAAPASESTPAPEAAAPAPPAEPEKPKKGAAKKGKKEGTKKAAKAAAKGKEGTSGGKKDAEIPPAPTEAEPVTPSPPPPPQLLPEEAARVEADLRASLSASPPSLDAPLAASIFRSAREPGWDRPVQDGDPEKIFAYQEEEFQRQLRGEHEPSQASLGEVVWGNMERPMRLTSIRVAPPPPTTRTGFLDAMLRPFMGRVGPQWLYNVPPPPENLHEVLLTTKYLIQHVDQLGVFDMARTGVRLEPAPSGHPDEVELVLALREKGRLFLKAGTEFGGNEGGGNVTARIRNALGGGEALELNAALGTKTRSAYQASLTVPVLASPYLNFQVSGFSLDRDNTAFASHRELSQGGRLRLAAITPWGNHDFAYEYVHRDINHLSPKASVSIREDAIPSTKAAISHTWTSDTRDDPWMGTAGRLLKATHEYAGLPGSSERAHFMKSTTQSQASRALYPGSNIFVSVASFTSILFPLWQSGGDLSKSTYLPDRTFLGGPNSVRGWKVGGLGLSDKADSLGGDLAYGVGVSMFAPIPSKPQWPLKLHTFMNLGEVLRYDQTRSFAENISRMYGTPSVSAGIGLMYRFDPLRIELNFSMPLVARRGERLGRGFSVGVGLEFL